MDKKTAIKYLELLFSDASNEDYPFTETFSEAVHTAINILKECSELEERFSGTTVKGVWVTNNGIYLKMM